MNTQTITLYFRSGRTFQAVSYAQVVRLGQISSKQVDIFLAYVFLRKVLLNLSYLYDAKDDKSETLEQKDENNFNTKNY